MGRGGVKPNLEATKAVENYPAGCAANIMKEYFKYV
jgi:hypothetical protein